MMAKSETKTKPFIIVISAPALIGTLLGAALVAYSLGCVTRRRGLMLHQRRAKPHTPHLSGQLGGTTLTNWGWQPVCDSFKRYNECHEISVEPVVHDFIIEAEDDEDEHDGDDEDEHDEDEEDDEDEAACAGDHSWNKDEYDEDEDEDEHDADDEDDLEGQDLLIDIHTSDLSLAESKEVVLRKMASVLYAIDETTMESYHCQQPWKFGGFSCVGIVGPKGEEDEEAGRIRIHTWREPQHTAMVQVSLDVFLYSDIRLILLLPAVHRIFDIPEVPTESRQLKWSYKLHRVSSSSWDQDAHLVNPYRYDLGTDYAYRMDLPIKKQVVMVQTAFQRVDIFDVLRPSFQSVDAYRRSLSPDDGSSDPLSYEAQHPEFYSLERYLLLDGVMQSVSSGEGPYHEALVHPAMFAHENPKRVAIIGGGEGATLREVLKHNTVEKVSMIEIDEQVVTLSRKYLPQWCDCSDLVGRAAWCPEDPRADMRYTDAFGWFMTKYSDENMDSITDDELFDVIIGDALDPADHVEFASDLYGNDGFSKSLYNALSPKGVLVIQVGETSQVGVDVPEFFNVAEANLADLQLGLRRAGFQSFHDFEESHCRFLAPWSFLLVFKSFESRELWYADQPQVDLAIHERIVHTVSGEPALKYFDGATKKEYQRPHKADGVMHCREVPRPEACDLFEWRSKKANAAVRLSDLEIEPPAKSGNGGEWSVVSRVAISKGSQIAVDLTLDKVHFAPSTLDVVEQLADNNVAIKAVVDILDKYAMRGETTGKPHASIAPSVSLLLEILGRKKSYKGNVEVRSLLPTPRSLLSNVTADRQVEDLFLDIAAFATRDIEVGEPLHC